ncbi:hypothetical protein QTL97_13535 [Sporosarcina thermotolerans]|uniref:Uncharacterized protein n=1 Tax=Sporosarcina thermotolerans TaxID=633404 RepID=A0AAW9A8J6_9BACL|nr:hypothetical protein [Sporosarcina thermotolerans]MDW0117961.1 hypothetical protein [Sporosarcina thermotolerans]WHT49044.1 hypothetical protein QNH10_05015 [Sporosarcina thermotolerans]
MLTFEEKQQIIETKFPELIRKEVSMKRLNYHYEDSLYEKTVVVQHLHPNGNGFVYVEGLSNYEPDDRGLVNIREATEDELITTIRDAIRALSTEENEKEEKEEPIEEVWVNNEGQKLKLLEEDGFFNVYHGSNLEDGFGDYKEAVDYLKEESFKRGGGDSK